MVATEWLIIIGLTLLVVFMVGIIFILKKIYRWIFPKNKDGNEEWETKPVVKYETYNNAPSLGGLVKNSKAGRLNKYKPNKCEQCGKIQAEYNICSECLLNCIDDVLQK